MTAGGPSPVGEYTLTLREKLKKVEIKIVERSELPVRVIKKRTGVTLGSFETQLDAEKFLENLPDKEFQTKVTRGKQGNTSR